jgi:hypothetical protein
MTKPPAIIPLPMLEKIEDAAIDCASIRLAGESGRVTSIMHVANEVARQFRRVATVGVIAADVTVSFTLATA